MNPLKALQKYDQAIWLDFLARSFITKGALQALVQEDGVRGVTSNPAIFEKAIVGSDEYDTSIKQMLDEGDHSVSYLYENLAVEDIRRAADTLRPIYDSTDGADGFVSLEVSPYLAMNTQESVAEGRRLWKMINRVNVMIKVPATQPGLPAIRALIADGINVNITLLFSREVYRQVVEVYLSGLEAFVTKGGDLSRMASVASFFVSRIDSAVEKLLDEEIARVSDPDFKQELKSLKGKVAIANAKLAYRDYTRLFGGERWRKLEAKGARPQRLLWASTGTKNKAYSDVLYVDELIGPNTVNTVPPATLDAFRDHGKPSNTLEHGVDDAQRVIDTLASSGISLKAVTDQLVHDGIKLFADAADSLLGAVAKKRTMFLGAQLNEQLFTFAADLAQNVEKTVEEWRSNGNVRRLWSHDASLWTGADEGKWLGWLDSVEGGLVKLGEYQAFADEIRREYFTHAVLLGMGGSSLGPEVLAQTFGSKLGWPKLLILDSTDPAQISAIEAIVDLNKTIFFVSSKSGTTIEPNMLMSYFFARLSQALGRESAGRRFVAITDPGSQLEKFANRNDFRRVFHGEPSVGGRYSVMSPFGLVPVAAAGIDVALFLKSAQAMVRSCAADVPPSQNPGVRLGVAMGLAGLAGRDKVTILSSPNLASFGGWAEQLIAESTGKNGRALMPVDDEPLGRPEVYGSDRFFIDLRMENESSVNDTKLDALERAGHPVVRIVVKSVGQIGQEFFRFEIATAVAGALLDVNPFDQPDVEASKAKTRDLTSAFEESGTLPAEIPVFFDKAMEIYADVRNAQELHQVGAKASVDSWLRAHFGRIQPSDYAAILAYVERNAANVEILRAARLELRDRLHVATSVGFGPRFLHSTGQAYKGGPNTGVFLQITTDDKTDLSIPGHAVGFGIIKAAQARADFEVLAGRGRRTLRVHLRGDTSSGLAVLRAAITRVLS